MLLELDRNKKRKIGLYFGSFNPVHIGHLILANYFLEYTDINDLEFIISPQNPLKSLSTLATENHRLEMLRIALASYPDLPIRINTIEFELPKPSYTIDTLTVLQNQHPNTSYVLLMGADNLANFANWKDYRKLLTDYEICVYPRIGSDLNALSKMYDVTILDTAPIIEISATFLRDAIRKGINVSTYLPYGVWDYIMKQELYLEVK